MLASLRMSSDIGDTAESPAPFKKRSQRLAGFLSLLFRMLVMASIGLLLMSPCLAPGKLPSLESARYDRLCSDTLQAYRNTAVKARIFINTLAAQAGNHYKVFQPSAANAWTKAGVSTCQAASTGRAAVGAMMAEAASGWQRAQPAIMELANTMVSHIKALLDVLLMRFTFARQLPAIVPSPISAVRFADFWALLDQSSVRRDVLQQLWDKAAEDAAARQKATVWLMTYRVDDECLAAASELSAAAVSHFRVDGRTYSHPDGASQLQNELLKFLWSHPDGLVLVVQPELLHAVHLTFLVNTVSGSGQLPVGGRPASPRKALFVFMAQGPSRDKNVVTAKWTAQSVSAQAPEYGNAVVAGFGHQVDAVLPLRKLPGVLSDGSDAPGISARVEMWRELITRRGMQGYHVVSRFLGDLLHKEARA